MSVEKRNFNRTSFSRFLHEDELKKEMQRNGVFITFKCSYDAKLYTLKSDTNQWTFEIPGHPDFKPENHCFEIFILQSIVNANYQAKNEKTLQEKNTIEKDEIANQAIGKDVLKNEKPIGKVESVNPVKDENGNTIGYSAEVKLNDGITIEDVEKQTDQISKKVEEKVQSLADEWDADLSQCNPESKVAIIPGCSSESREIIDNMNPENNIDESFKKPTEFENNDAEYQEQNQDSDPEENNEQDLEPELSLEEKIKNLKTEGRPSYKSIVELQDQLIFQLQNKIYSEQSKELSETNEIEKNSLNNTIIELRAKLEEKEHLHNLSGKELYSAKEKILELEKIQSEYEDQKNVIQSQIHEIEDLKNELAEIHKKLEIHQFDAIKKISVDQYNYTNEPHKLTVVEKIPEKITLDQIEELIVEYLDQKNSFGVSIDVQKNLGIAGFRKLIEVNNAK